LNQIDWRKTLHDISDSIQSSVYTVLPQRGTMPVNRFKDLLDHQAQTAITEYLTKYDIPVKLVSEEGDKTFGAGTHVITADPVDGTSNLARGLSPAVSSLSVSESDHQSGVFAGIVTNFYTGETFYAEKNQGATLDDQPIRVAAPEKYSRALISIDISKGPRLDCTRRLLEMSRHLRSEGSSAMSLCHVASGTMDAHIDLRGIVRATDVSAGLLILKEAGGLYTVDGVQGGDFPLTRDTHMELVAAGSTELLDEINSLMGQP